jgi:K+-transporting ATPase A subunit
LKEALILQHFQHPQSHEQSEVTYEMARDEARHGKAFAGLLARYFGK